jgi:hypothetical protein
MTITINGTSGVTFPAGGVANPAGSYVGTTDTQALSAKTVSFVAGTTTVPPIQFSTNNALLSSVTQGAIELDSSNFYYTATANSRGVLPNFVTFCTTANGTYAASSPQGMFGNSNGGTLTIGAVGTYLFRLNFADTCTSTPAASGIAFAFAGTATIASIFYRGESFSATNSTVTGFQTGSGFGQGVSTTSAATQVILSTNNNPSQWQGDYAGAITFSSTGTLIPQVTFTSANASTLLLNTSFMIWPIGSLGQSGTSVYVGNWT